MTDAPTKKRRPKGEGTFRYRGDRAIWEASFDLGKDHAGKRRRRVLYGKTRAELQRKIADLRARSGGTIRTPAKGTVGEYVEQWLRDDVRPNRRAKTYQTYEGSWRVHAAPLIGSVKLEKFDVEHVTEMYRRLRERGVSGAGARHVASMLHAAFGVAVRRRAYTKANPFDLVEKPAHTPKEGRSLTIAEARRFLDAARTDRFEALWVLCLTAGLRIGEALALRWSDVDLGKGTLAIQRTATVVKGRVEFGPTKTHRSRRRVDVGTLALAAIRRRRDAWQNEGHGSELVFCTTIGTPIAPSNLRRRHFLPLLERARLGPMRIHDLRHTMTSLGVAAGLLPKILAERLGHTTTRLTEDRYSHVLPGHGAEAAMAIDALLGRK